MLLSSYVEIAMQIDGDAGATGGEVQSLNLVGGQAGAEAWSGCGPCS